MKVINILTIIILLSYSSLLLAEDSNMNIEITNDTVENLALLPLNCIQQEYPNKPNHVINGLKDVKTPKQIHPSFYGCYDWHSSVHSHWLLVYILKNFPQLKIADNIIDRLNENLTTNNILKEIEYINDENRKSFERPYGWAWLLKLYEELYTWQNDYAIKWREAIEPLAKLVASKYKEYFPKQTYPIRTGTHSNTAFGLTFAYDYAITIGDNKLENIVAERAKKYFLDDTNYPAELEPNGNDFLSPCLTEADLMRRILTKTEFSNWFHKFLPNIADNKPESLLNPAVITDRSDPQIVHLDGLNLSRAWCMYGIAKTLDKDDPSRKILLESAEKHAKSALANVTSGFYEGEHWLATFAVYMINVFNNY
ncbi:MAG: DUF2891 domain-containing protein [Deferribacterota bacterium]|nr:DUF2891 domain-containing protein [Deferribacterota bacterium]